MIYMDNAATTKIDAEVLEAMMPYLTEEYGNAGALYRFGRGSKRAIQAARERVLNFVGGSSGKVIFTSGGSESNSLVFRGVFEHLKRAGKTHILVSAVEHDSVLRAAEGLESEGFEVERIPVQADGSVSLTALKRLLRAETGLVSVMYVNNETGAVNPICDIGDFCKKRSVLFHTDCVQAAGSHPIDAKKIKCDFLSISSHKIHGPKGVGALYVKNAAILGPLIYGGKDQEYGLRGGTENVAGIVGFGKACELAGGRLQEDRTYVSSLKQKFMIELTSALEGAGFSDMAHINGGSILTPGKTVNLRLDGVDSETLILMLDSLGVCISAGSACQSRNIEPSHVLTAMGLMLEEARSSIRVSFSRMNTEEEVIEAARLIAKSSVTLVSSWVSG